MPEIVFGLDGRSLFTGVERVKSSLNSISSVGSKVGSALGKIFNPLTLAIGGIASIATVKQLADVGDAYTNMAGQLKYLTGSAENAERAQEGLYRMSQDTRSSMLENAKALTRFELANEMTGLSTEQNIEVLGGINTLLKQTGVSSQEASSGMIQLGQALASGRLQGDEFRSLSENMPALMNNLAKSLGLTRAELKEMASQSKLTSDVLGGALLEMAQTAKISGDELPVTISGMWTKVVNAFQNAWDKVNDKTGILAWFAEGIDNLSLWIEQHTDLIVKYALQMKDKLIEMWPKIKEWFKKFMAETASLSQMFYDALPYIKYFVNGTIQLFDYLTPKIITLIEWFQKLLNISKEVATYTPLAAASRAAGTLAGGGSIIDAAKSFFDADNSMVNDKKELDTVSSHEKSAATVNVNYNGQYSRSDATNVALDLIRQVQRE